MMPFMPYQHDEQARQEANVHRISDGDAEQLRVLCLESLRGLGGAGLRGHAAQFRTMAWHGLPGLPDVILNRGQITRGDVLDIGERVRAGDCSPVVLLAASFAWGTGTTGYGPRRYREIVDAAGAMLEPSLRQALDAIYQDPRSSDPVAGYAQLYGGCKSGHRAQAGQAPWSRLHKLGPAFFTKFLYFAVPGALVLDNRVANAVYERSGLPHLVAAGGRSVAWTPYRYAVYLHWMQRTARTIGTRPEMLEFTLFQPPADPIGEHDAHE
jgi:Putative 8-oxoguanine DNA glycosylase OGG-like protein